MRVQVLGCSGAIARGRATTSFLLDDDLLVDAGTGACDLSLEEMSRIDHVLLTHAHLDHIVALPLMLDAVGGLRSKPLQVHALQFTLDSLKAHIFNGTIWPDFSKIPSEANPFATFHAIEVGQTLRLGGKDIEVLPAVHTVPALGFAVARNSGKWVFTGDTEHNPALWGRVNQLDVAMLIIEATFSNREGELARRSLHLSPKALAIELDCISQDKQFPIYITHTKPASAEQIKAEVEDFAALQVAVQNRRHDIHWLQAGQVFEL